MLWDSLPLEIQTGIIEALVLHGDSAQYASTCRAWQTIIERKLFACLKVTRSRLAGFRDIGYRHRHLVKCIWFSIEPSEYLCPDCGGVAFDQLHRVSSITIRKAIQDLVIRLSRWEPRGSLSLDISVKAPSAVMHSSTIIQYGPPVISEPKNKIVRCSYWLHDTKTSAPFAYLFNKRRKVREPKVKPSHEMPKARAVTSLLLRRQTRYPWKLEVFEEILDLLPEVREIHYEPWRDWRQMEKQPSNTCKARDGLT